MSQFLRRRLFSKQFFALLVAVLALDLVADILEFLAPGRHEILNSVAIGIDLIALVLAGWMLVDLSRSREHNGDHSRRG
jgi:hypothetical protein